MSIVKNFYLLLALFVAASACAQTAPKVVGSSEIQYDSQKKIYNLRSTNKPFTGMAYSVNYYSQKDTTIKQYFSNGRLDQTISYNNKFPSYITTWYNHGLKNDSICYENYTFDYYSHDTVMYDVHYIDKKKVKWFKQYTYHHQGSGAPKGKKIMASQRTFRFFTRAETKGFTEYSFKDENSFDSAGYHNTYAETGYSASYYVNGKVQTEGYSCMYEQRIQNKGQYNYQSYGGRCGSWKYYSENGVLTREEVYDPNVATVDLTYYNTEGRPYSRQNYSKKGSLVKLPPTQGIVISNQEDVFVTQTTWNPEGKLTSETVRRANGDVITYSYYADGKPQSVAAYASGNKPFGVHKNWDDKGRITDYVNYSVEWCDTVCYTAVNGKMQALNLRTRNVPINWVQMPITYYGNETKAYLYKQVTMCKRFHPNGKLKLEVSLKDGKMNGLYKEYDSTGTQIVQVSYKSDVADGAWTEWYPNGKVKKSFYYKDGMREGNCSEYYSTGSIKWENIYTNGVPGKPKAYAENGSLLQADNYLEAFFPATCVETQAKNVRGAALHYYFMDTTLSRSSLTIPDSVVNDYVYKVIAVTNAITPGYDMCDAKSTYATEDGFDIYHSCFLMSNSLYTTANLDKIKKFFARNGMQFDKSTPNDNPVLGLEKEYLVYYSSKQMLNKQLVIDSLESFLAPRAIDAKQGYLMSVDNNIPEGGIAGIGAKAVLTSDTGYSTIVVESGVRNNAYPNYPAYNTWKSTRYVIYDDLTSDVLRTESAVTPMLYWAGK